MYHANVSRVPCYADIKREMHCSILYDCKEYYLGRVLSSIKTLHLSIIIDLTCQKADELLVS